MDAYRRVISLLALAALLAPLPATADEPADQAGTATGDSWRLALSLGSQRWPALAELQAGGEETFDSNGFLVDLSLHGKAANGWLLGLDAGISHTEGDIPGLYTSMNAGTLYLTPSVKIPVGGAPLYLDLGLGYYRADFGEMECDLLQGWGCVDLGERWYKNTVGGYIGASWDHHLGKTGSALALAVRVHFADYGVPGVLGPAAGRLNGPATTVLVGFVF